MRQVPDEADYRRIHQAFPLSAAAMLRAKSPAAPFHYVSGGSAGLKSWWMWARVKAEAERDLMQAVDALCSTGRSAFVKPGCDENGSPSIIAACAAASSRTRRFATWRMPIGAADRSSP